VSPEQGLAFVRRHGIVLQAARGPVRSLAEAIVGGAIRGSWWGHPKGQEIHRVTEAVGESPEVLVCKLIDGKVTYIHRRLWPALVRLASRFQKEQLTGRAGPRVGGVAPPRFGPACGARAALSAARRARAASAPEGAAWSSETWRSSGKQGCTAGHPSARRAENVDETRVVTAKYSHESGAAKRGHSVPGWDAPPQGRFTMRIGWFMAGRIGPGGASLQAGRDMPCARHGVAG
jgi:hypothetical protein